MATNIRGQLAPKGLHFNPSDFFISDKYATILTVISYPKYISPGYLASLTNMSGIKIVIKHIPIAYQQMVKMLNKQVADLQQKFQDEKDQTLKERYRQEAEEEYLKNVKKYEDIIQDNPEQRFKLPPPPFGSSNIPMMNKMSMESQIQGAEPGYINKMNQVSENPYSIDKYNLGESNLKQNPILHPVNSYQFDFRRLYNPLTNKNN